ncbi:MAG: UTP--glucose-1-phosphate uridylyltransferase [Bdellovibrionaceae bacterium]|nr:UTP--glucose-1-phosphate uridylyltransferase [Pseudobdellovibrionaceae bacterium]
MSSNKVKKAVIPAAGLGTRFFPATKTIPKEMLPIVDKPTILYVIEEAMNAGIEDIILIQGRGKTAIEDFFDISYEIENKLIKDGKEDLLKNLNYIRNNINIISLRQKEALGLGHAIRCAKTIVGNDPFAVLLGDEITIPKNNHENVTGFLCDQYAKTEASSVWVLPVQANQTEKYGMVDLGKDKFDKLDNGAKILGVVEKPKSEKAPSLWALPGRYVFDAKIFDYIDEIKPGYNGELQLSDAMHMLAQKQNMQAYSFNARRFDAGDKLGYLIANIEVALDRDDLKHDLYDYLKNRIK